MELCLIRPGYLAGVGVELYQMRPGMRWCRGSARRDLVKVEALLMVGVRVEALPNKTW